MLREIIHGSYLYASASRHASPGATVGGFTVCLPTITRPPDTSSARANRWTNAQCFQPLPTLPTTVVWLLINNQRTTPVRRACSTTGPGDADANKGPRAVWSGRPTQREEGGRQQKGRQPLQPRKIFAFSALSEPQ